MIEAFELSDLRKAGSTPSQDERKQSETSVVDEILKYFQQLSTPTKPQVFMKTCTVSLNVNVVLILRLREMIHVFEVPLKLTASTQSNTNRFIYYQTLENKKEEGIAFVGLGGHVHTSALPTPPPYLYFNTKPRPIPQAV